MPVQNDSNITYVDIHMLNMINHDYVYFHYTIIILMSIWLIVTNSFILFIFAKYPQRRSLTNAPIINIAVTDLLIGLVHFLGIQVYLVVNIPIEAERIRCLIANGLHLATNEASIHALFCAVLERYV